MEFEWDENKAKMNLSKHGVSFVAAARVFFDPFRLERVDNRKDYEEERYQLIGSSGRGILFVVNVFRGSRLRIISARPANRKERGLYEKNKYNKAS